jgi:hypothetical protein
MNEWFIRVRCKILGHKWRTVTPGYQNCERPGCVRTRSLMIKKFPKIGEPQSRWEIDPDLRPFEDLLK